MQQDFHNRVLVICPLSVRNEWIRQLAEHYPFKHKALLYPKDVEKRHKLLTETRNVKLPIFIILNYDILANDLNVLKNWRPHTVILDESHLIGRHNSRRSAAADILCSDAVNVLLLTGTPIPKKWYHIFGQFRAMDRRIFGSSFRKFIDKWGIMGGFSGKEIIGCKDYDALAKIISEHSVRVLRKDIFQEPTIEHVVLPITPSAKLMKQYNELKRTCMLEIGDQEVTATLAMIKTMRLQQLCGGFITTDEGISTPMNTDKLEVLQDLVETKLEGEEKVVIFYRFTAEGDAIYNVLSPVTAKPVVRLNGQVAEKDRLIARDMFQNGESDVMLVQIATGAMGVSFDTAHINIFYSLDFSLSNLQQARDRVMGRNQDKPVTNYYLGIDRTVDFHIMDVLSKDQDIAERIVDVWAIEIKKP